MSRRPTQKQQQAYTRNWKIRNLRALHALCKQLSGDELVQAQAAVDRELTKLGAETTEERRERENRELLG